MKKNKLLLSLILFSLTLFSCKDEGQKLDYAVISGKVDNNGGGEILLINRYNYNIDTLQLKEDGSFVDTLKVEPIHYHLRHGRSFQLIYLEPGFELNVSFDAEHFDNTLTFSGTGAEINNYLLKKTKKQKELGDDGLSIYDLNEEEAKLMVKEEKALFEEMLDKYNLPGDFKKREKRNIHYAYINNLMRYNRFLSRTSENSTYVPSEDFLAEIKNVGYDNVEDYLFSKDYRGLVRAHYSEKADVVQKNDSIPEKIIFLKVLGNIENDTIRNNLLFDEAQFRITLTDHLESYYNNFMDASTNEEHKEKITNSYNKLKKVAPGQPSPRFVNYENYDGGVTSLADLKGKYLYLDIWATWCGPCIAEIPDLKRIEKEFHDKNIEFVSISIDAKENENKWREMIEEKDLGGIQLLADNAWESKFIGDYLIKGIPRFILIDPEGNIVDSSAPRPSDPKLIELFDSLNI